jgi:predicted RNase H-like HicB family nuclease
LCEITHTMLWSAARLQRFYPAVLERGAKETFGVWFPDFPRCVAGGTSQEQAIARATEALAQSVQLLVERERALPEPTPFEKIEVPKDCDLVAFFAIGVEPPDPSERVNVYLSKSLIARVDRRAAELGMSRSSFFGYAITSALSQLPAGGFGHLAPIVLRTRSKELARRRPTGRAKG